MHFIIFYFKNENDKYTPSNNNLNDYGAPIKEIDFLDNIFSFCFPIYHLLPLHPSLYLYLLPEYLHTSIGISLPLSVALPSPSSSAKLSPMTMRPISHFSSLSLYSSPNLHHSSHSSSSSQCLSSSLVLVGSHHNGNQRRAYRRIRHHLLGSFPHHNGEKW